MKKTTSLTSSNIDKMDYKEDSGLLTVTFHSKQTYEYYNVPKQVYEKMMQQPSLGAFFRANIYKQYRYAKIAAS